MTPPLLRALALTLLLAVGGCHALLDGHYRDTLPPEQGSITLEGLHKPVSVRRNALVVERFEIRIPKAKLG